MAQWWEHVATSPAREGESPAAVGAGRGGGPCATAGRIFSARFESSRVLNGFVLLFCFFVQVFVAGGAAWQGEPDGALYLYLLLCY